MSKQGGGKGNRVVRMPATRFAKIQKRLRQRPPGEKRAQKRLGRAR